jgi:hypothetical protein
LMSRLLISFVRPANRSGIVYLCINHERPQLFSSVGFSV